MSYTTTVDGGPELAAVLARINAALSDLQPAMEIGARLWLNRIQLGFRAGRDPWGNRWAPLRQRRGQPLRDTGRLQRSFTTRSDATGFSIGTNTCYAIAHQFGATVRADQPAGRVSLCGYVTKGSPFLRWRTRDGKWHAAKQVTIPRRAMLPITEGGTLALPQDWVDDLAQTLERHIMGGAA